MIYQIEIKGEPVAKARPRMTKTGHIYTPAKTKHQEAEITLAWVRKYDKIRLENAVGIEVTFNMKKPQKTKDRYVLKRPDIDNLLKTVLDGLNGVAYIDDKQVCRITGIKRWAENWGKEPSTMISVMDYGGKL